MNKQEFIQALRQRLAARPAEDIEKHIQYYSEMIDDRMEDGMTEEEAVAGIELPEQITETGTPQKTRQSLPVWAIILLILGAPIWLSLLVTVVSVILSVYVVVWSAVIALYTVPISLGAAAFVGLIGGTSSLITGKLPLAAAFWGICFAGAGLCVFSVCLCNLAAKGTVLFTKWSIKHIRSLFTRKEAAA